MRISVLGPGLGLVLAAFVAPAAGQAPTPCAALPEAAPDAGIHAPLDRLLGAHVADGRVSYRCLKRDEAVLDGYLATLAGTDPAALPAEERLALWIDAYNAFTLKLILGHYPGIASIKDIPGRWDRKDWRVGGTAYSLGEIEHEVLRKRFAEPRIHFAIVCASRSCPDLAAEAYVAPRIDAQLDRQARRFLADETKGFRARTEPGRLWGENHTVYLSPIFQWFSEDFARAAGSAVAFVRPLVPDDGRAFIDAHRDDLSIRWLDYDWSLNGE